MRLITLYIDVMATPIAIFDCTNYKNFIDEAALEGTMIKYMVGYTKSVSVSFCYDEMYHYNVLLNYE